MYATTCIQILLICALAATVQSSVPTADTSGAEEATLDAEQVVVDTKVHAMYKTAYGGGSKPSSLGWHSRDTKSKVVRMEELLTHGARRSATARGLSSAADHDKPFVMSI